MATRSKRRTGRKKATGRKRKTRKSTRGRRKKATVRRKAPRRKAKKKTTRRRRRNPAKQLTKKQILAGFGGKSAQARAAFGTWGGKTKSGAIKRKGKKKKRRMPLRGKYSKARGTQAKKARGRATYRTKTGKRRARPYRGRKKRVTLHKGYAMAPKRKRRLVRGGYLSRVGKVNPRKRKKRKKNPTFMGTIRSIASRGFVRSTVQTLGGMAAAVVMPSVIESLSRGRVRNSGAQGVMLTGAAVVVNTMAAGYVENFFSKRRQGGMFLSGLTRNVMVGGGLVLATRALFHFAPRFAEWLKLSPVRTPVVDVAGGVMSGMLGMGSGHGMADWVELQGMQGMSGAGLGAATSNEALIAGESFARSVSQFEGLGQGSASDRIPMGDIRAPGQALSGYPGQYGGGGYMGDWLETVGGSALAMTSFDPAMETF